MVRSSPLLKVRSVLVLAAALLAVSVPGVAAAQGPTNASTAIELVGSNASRPILLSLRKVKSPKAATVLQGELHLVLRNVGKSKKRVRLLYARDEHNALVLPDGSNSVQLVLPAAPSRGYVSVRAGSVRQLALRFRLPTNRPPGDLDGTIEVETLRPRPADPIKQLALPVTGKLRPLDVRFDPSSSVVQVTRGCLFGCNTTDGGTVRLLGTGVGLLLTELRQAGQVSIDTTLRRGSGQSVEVTLTDLEPDSERPGSAVAKLTLGSEPEPGKYSGKLALSRLAADAPSLPIEVRSRVWVVWTVLFIFAGVLVAAMIFMQLGLNRRKQLLKDALERVVGQYCEHAQGNLAGSNGGDPLIWKLSVDCPLRKDPNWNYYDELDTANSIYTATYWARTEADLDEVQTAALKLVVGVKAWMLVLNECAALWELARAHREEVEPGQLWGATNVARDSDLLLRKARRPPADAQANSQLMDQIQMQTAWHRSFAEAWDLQIRLQRAGGDAGAKAAQVPLKELDQEAKPVASRSRDQQDELDRKLEALRARLLRLRDESNRDETTRDVPLVALSAGPQEVEAATLRAELDSLQSLSAQPQLALATLTAGPSLAAPETGEVPNPEGGPAPSSAEPPAASAPAPPPASPPPAPVGNDVREGKRPSRLLRGLRRIDFAVSLVILIISSLVYAATVYDDTWGTPADWVTAFGAGIIGQLTIRWALLPIYRSIRMRTSAPPAKEAEAQAAVVTVSTAAPELGEQRTAEAGP